ncbi:MAG: PQQ-dependent sugar dehydrogenase [Planctomycetota bacterium]
MTVLRTALGALALTSALATHTHAQIPVASQLVANGFTQPLYVTHAPGDSTRLFVVEKAGRIKIIQGGSVLGTPFLDMSSLVNSSTLEWGLLGLCFDSSYATNGFFYVNYNSGPGGDTNIARFTVTANPNVADFGSRQTILFLAQPNVNHRGGWLAFGNDGYLYDSQGDGGGQNDPSNRAQNLALLQGKILRLDVSGDDFPADPNKNYKIPPTNPFVGVAGAAPEIWAYGLRNPWRCSFDRQTFDLWVADVGQNQREELNFQAASSSGGQNYGWRCTEGTFCTGLSGCTCNGPTLTPPIHEYNHAVGLSITGGYVYRGSAIAGLQGTYFFAEFQFSKLFSLRYDGVTASELTDRTAQLDPAGALTLGTPAAFGEDADGELYICDYNGGELYKIVPVSTPTAYCFGDGTGAACPCANSGAPGHGCAHSFGLSARLASTGTASLSADTLSLNGTDMPSGTLSLYFQGTEPINGGLGTPGADGLRCAGGTQLRLGIRTTVVGGSSSYPVGADLSVSIKGAVGSPGTRYYQTWYRNSMLFCTSETTNYSNGLIVAWGP